MCHILAHQINSSLLEDTSGTHLWFQSGRLEFGKARAPVTYSSLAEKPAKCEQWILAEALPNYNPGCDQLSTLHSSSNYSRCYCYVWCAVTQPAGCKGFPWKTFSVGERAGFQESWILVLCVLEQAATLSGSWFSPPTYEGFGSKVHS